jgi:hypothetical protein
MERETERDKETEGGREREEVRGLVFGHVKDMASFGEREGERERGRGRGRGRERERERERESKGV